MADHIIAKVYDQAENALRTTGGGGGGDASAANQTTIIGHIDALETKLDALLNPTFTAPASGELAGSATAVQGPSVACKMVMFTALASNAGKVYIGASGVTVPNGTTDTTSGIELAPGASTPWIPVDNLSRLYRICDNATDDLTYLALA